MFPFDPPFDFQGDQKGTLGSKGLIVTLQTDILLYANSLRE